MMLTAAWTFHFDREQHIIDVPVVGFVCFFSYRNLVRICRRLEMGKSQLNGLGLAVLSGAIFIVKKAFAGFRGHFWGQTCLSVSNLEAKPGRNLNRGNPSKTEGEPKRNDILMLGPVLSVYYFEDCFNIITGIT